MVNFKYVSAILSNKSTEKSQNFNICPLFSVFILLCMGARMYVLKYKCKLITVLSTQNKIHEAYRAELYSNYVYVYLT
jgi:hypothetical protein